MKSKHLGLFNSKNKRDSSRFVPQLRDYGLAGDYARNDKGADPILMNLNKLMKQAQKMQEQMSKTQAELEKQTIEVSAGGGKVKVTANGAGDIIAIKIDREVVDPDDVEFLEEIVLSAVKQAVEQGKALAQSEMTKITGGLSGLL